MCMHVCDYVVFIQLLVLFCGRMESWLLKGKNEVGEAWGEKKRCTITCVDHGIDK